MSIVAGSSNLIFAQSADSSVLFTSTKIGTALLFVLLLLPLALYLLRLIYNFGKISASFRKNNIRFIEKEQLSSLNQEQIDVLLSVATKQKSQINSTKSLFSAVFFGALLLSPLISTAQSDIAPATRANIMSQPGVIISLVLIFIPLLVAVLLLMGKVKNIFGKIQEVKMLEEAKMIAENLKNPVQTIETEQLEQRKKALDYRLTDTELAGNLPPIDEKGLLHNVRFEHEMHLFATKKKPIPRPKIDPKLTQLILGFLARQYFGWY